MKRIIAILMLVAMLLSMAACGAKKPNQDEVLVDAQGNVLKGNFLIPEGGYDGSEVTITFSHTMGANLREELDKHIKRFNELYPNIHIEHSFAGDWASIPTVINTAMNADNQPNIAYCYPDHVAQYNNAKAVVILDDLIESKIEVIREDGSKEILGLTQEQIDDFVDVYYEEGRVYGDGKMYTLPMIKSTEVLYYNKDFFTKHNLTAPTTWDEMETLCKKMLEIDPKCIPLGYDSADNWFITMCEQYGYGYTSATGDEHFLFNNDNCKAFVKELREWYQAGYITTKDLQSTYTSNLFKEQDMSVSHSYMSIGSSGGAQHQMPDGRFEVGIAPLPQVDPANPKAISQGPSLCIMKGGKTTDQEIIASWLFVKFLCTDVKFQTGFSSTSGYTPVIESALEYENYKEWLAEANGYESLIALAVKVSLDVKESGFISAAFDGSSAARDQAGILLTKAMSAETTDVDKLIDDVFQDAYDECIYQTE